MTLQPGATIGRYTVIEPLGVGGMATVYKAYQPSLDREVALKVLRPGFADDKEFFERFQREARSIARLRHPHIVQVFDFEPLDGRYVLAMEFLEGGTLKDRMTSLASEGKKMPPADVVRIIGEVASALTYSHRLGIVHRDIKPANVMLSERDRAVVTDFGIAKILSGEGQTQTGVGMGTPEYMAPEQGSGEKIDHRADIYSLGVMAYEMLAGRVPFVADTPLAVVLAHMKDPLPLPSALDPSIGKATERVLLKALAKDAGERYASATDFADALRAAVPVAPGPTDAGVAPAETPRRALSVPRPALLTIGLLALLLVGAAALAINRGGAAAPVATVPSASAAPSVAHGALLYELDRTAAGASRVTVTGKDRSPVPAKFLGSAVQLDVPGNSNSTVNLTAGNFDDFVVELLAQPLSGKGRVTIGFHSNTQGSTTAFLMPVTGEVGINASPSGSAQPDAIVPQAVRVLGRPTAAFEMTVSVRGRTVVVYVDGLEVARGDEARAQPGSIYLVVAANTNETFSLSVTALRIYAPAPTR